MLAEHLQTEEQEVENGSWETVVEWMKITHQTEIAHLKSQVFVAETVLEAREVDIANEKDDHDADLRAIETLKKERSDLRKRSSERSTELRHSKKEIKILQKSLEETLEDGKGSAARVTELEKQNLRLEATLKRATEEITRLRSGAISESTQEELKDLRKQNHLAQLEVGHLHANNACYRGELEGSNPARTAHIDNYLKCRDDEYTELETRAASCADELGEEQRNRAVDNVYAQGKINGLNTELAHRSNMIAALTESRETLQEQKEEIFQMFRGRIYQRDVDEAFRRDHDVIQRDNALLNKIVNERHFYLEDAEKPVADLKADKLILEHAARSDQLKMRQMQQYLRGQGGQYQYHEPSEAEIQNHQVDWSRFSGVDAGHIWRFPATQYCDLRLTVEEIHNYLPTYKSLLDIFITVGPETITDYTQDPPRQTGLRRCTYDVLIRYLATDCFQPYSKLHRKVGLEAKNGALQDKVEIVAEMAEETKAELNARIKQQAGEIERLLWNGAEDGWRQHSEAQAQELVNCRREVARLAGLADQWRMRALEVKYDFCPM